MTEHSKLPWSFGKNNDDYYIVETSEVDNNVNRGIALLEIPSYGPFIVKACNNHDKLVEALKNVIKLLESYMQEYEPDFNELPGPEEYQEAKALLQSLDSPLGEELGEK